MVPAVVLRVTQDSNLPELTVGDSEFDDWGSREPRRTFARSDTHRRPRGLHDRRCGT